MSVDNITWFKTDADSWELARDHRGYSAVIDIVAGDYQLTITGAGAPAPASYPTLRNAKNAFRKFLFDKPVA